MQGVRISAIIFGLLLVVFQRCLAQTGYNYARPEVALAGTTNTGQISLRPLVGGFPSGATTGTGIAATFPTANAAFGGVTASPNPAFSPFSPAQAQRSGAVTATGLLASGNALSVRQQATLPQRSSSVAGGIYGQQQFAGSGRGSGRGAVTGSGTSATGFEGEYSEGGGDFSAIPGVPGVDYPVYSQVPRTNFDCAQQALPGYYSDVEAQCQVFHICALNRTYSFLCPNGTLFSQEALVCVWWNQYDCATAPSLYANNAYIYDYSNQGAPTSAQALGTNTRQQPNYSTVRNPNVGSIYGSTYQGVPTSPIATVTTTGFPSVNAGRFSPTSQTGGTAIAQAFPTSSSVGTPSPFSGITIRGGPGGKSGIAVASVTEVGGGGGGGGATTPSTVGRTPYPIAQITTSSNNREYLPPRRP